MSGLFKTVNAPDYNADLALSELAVILYDVAAYELLLA